MLAWLLVLIALRQSSREKLWLEEAKTPMQYELSLDGV